MYKLVISGEQYSEETTYEFETVGKAMEIADHIRLEDKMNKLGDTYFKLIDCETNQIWAQGY